MNDEVLLPLLRETAERAKLEVRREGGAMPTGVCVLKGKVLVVIPRGTPPAEECVHLLDGLKRIDLSGVFVPPAVRDALES
jgi:hypothetical protein